VIVAVLKQQSRCMFRDAQCVCVRARARACVCVANGPEAPTTTAHNKFNHWIRSEPVSSSPKPHNLSPEYIFYRYSI
jgi:hypothetical protein